MQTAIIISSGTLRNEDLVPAFVDALSERLEQASLTAPKGSELEVAKAVDSAQIILGEIERSMERGADYYDSEDVYWDIEWLFDLLNTYAPEGMYFGAHETEGACFGFWPIEDEDGGI